MENPVQSVFHAVICLFHTYWDSANLRYISWVLISLNYEQPEYTENIILSKLPDKGTRDDLEKARENTIRLSRGLWLDEAIFFTTCEKLVSLLWLVEVKSETLFHTAKFDAKISVCMK